MLARTRAGRCGPAARQSNRYRRKNAVARPVAAGRTTRKGADHPCGGWRAACPARGRVSERALLIVNPAAGKRTAGDGDLGESVKLLEEAGFDNERRATRQPSPTPPRLPGAAGPAGDS